MLVIVSAELPLLGDWRDRHTWMQPLENILEPLKIWVPPFDCLSEDGRMDEIAHVGLFEHSSLFLFELGHTGLRILGTDKSSGRKLDALNLFVEDLTIALVIDFLKSFYSLWFCRALIKFFRFKKFFDHRISMSVLLQLLLLLVLLPLPSTFLELFLELFDDVLEITDGPILKIIASFLCLREVFLELLRIIVLFDDLLEEIVLLFFLVWLHLSKI